MRRKIGTGDRKSVFIKESLVSYLVSVPLPLLNQKEKGDPYRSFLGQELGRLTVI